MDRRSFLKIAGISAAAGGLTLTGCKQKKETANEGMTYRIHPENGDRISILGYGCMRWPVIKNEDGSETVDQEGVNRLVDYALENGVNYFDAAPMYHHGICEKVTGIALSRHPRDKYFVATKLSNFKDWSTEASMKMYRQSFEDLQTDHIDYYLLHSVGNLEVFNKRFVDNGMLDFLLEERKAGRIRNLGFSFHGQKKGFDDLIALHSKYHWDFVQIQLNYVDWTHASSRNTDAEYLLQELDKLEIPSIIMEPLLGGRLAKLPKHLAERLKERDPQKSAASWAFRFAGTPKTVLTVLSGMTYMEHLEDNIRTYSPLVPLTEEEARWLDGETANLIESYPTIPCNDCKYCMPCPYALDIPAILLHYNKCVNQGNVPESQQAENYQKARRAFLVGYDRSVPRLRQANRCISCRECVSHCPQNIDIPRELQRIDRFVEKLKQNKL